MGLVLVGAGGRAKALVEALAASGLAVTAYVHRADCAWLPGTRRYAARGWRAPAVVHPAAVLSASATLGEGSQTLAGAVVQPGAAVGAAAIVNTGGIVEHDSIVGEGAHVAPGAIVLGGVRIGACAMIGAGAVMLQGASVPDRTLVPANTRYPA